jgi:hypothetical protein
MDPELLLHVLEELIPRYIEMLRSGFGQLAEGNREAWVVVFTSVLVIGFVAIREWLDHKNGTHSIQIGTRLGKRGG